MSLADRNDRSKDGSDKREKTLARTGLSMDHGGRSRLSGPSVYFLTHASRLTLFKVNTIKGDRRGCLNSTEGKGNIGKLNVIP